MIAEHSAPALVAVAIVRFVAGAVVAAGVKHAIRAESALPSFATSKEGKRRDI